jgi:F420H(2)-dependent quinone reductase
MRLPRWVIGIANTVTNLALIAGIPRPPYTRDNALIVETIGRRSGKRRRVPVGFVEEAGRIIVVVEDGARAHWDATLSRPAAGSGSTSGARGSPRVSGWWMRTRRHTSSG